VRVLVANAGSTDLKLAVVEEDQRVAGVTIEGSPAPDAIEDAIAEFGTIDAVGHRIVHGGVTFVAPVVVDDAVRRTLEGLVALAPLHQPAALAVLDELRRIRPAVPHVACFDTAFHAGLPAEAATYAIPEAWRRQWGIRRFGFHGLSHEWAARRAGELADGPDPLAVVTCHLGGGSSLAAVLDGHSVDTTMGFSALDGVVMATRPGALDPGLVLWLTRQEGLDAARVEDALYHESGLRALTGDADARVVLERAATGDASARAGLAVMVHGIRAAVAAMTAAMGRLDVLVFTGGVGEHAAPVRAAVADGLGFLGVRIDPGRNTDATGDADVGAPGAAVRILVVTSREDLVIAERVVAALA